MVLRRPLSGIVITLYQGINPGQESLRKIYAGLPKPLTIQNLVTKTLR